MVRACLALLAVTAAADQLPLPDGSAEFEWLSAAAFRVKRTWKQGAKPSADSAVSFESRQLKVGFDIPSLRAVVTGENGERIAELGGPVRTAGGTITLDRTLAKNERVFGRTGAGTESPFFFSTAGYGQIVRGGARYLVDAGRTDATRLRVTAQEADSIEYVFLYGPSPKDIFDQRRMADPVADDLPRQTLRIPRLTCDGVRALNAASSRGDRIEYDAGPEWEAFLGAYVREIHDRGLPIVRPFAMQYPHDANVAKQMNATMFGDEMIVAPRCASPLTLPQGTWTDFRTNAEHKGRTAIALDADVTILARNGSIIPLKVKDVIELHYFPKLGAEFFLLEPDLAEYSQVHASPAGDFWRLEIESKVTRTYEWVLHHVLGETKRIRVEVKASVDHIISLPSATPVNAAN